MTRKPTDTSSAVGAVLAEVGVEAGDPVDIPLSKIDWDASETLQVRSGGVDNETIERYAGQMADGTGFPPGLVRPGRKGQFEIVDGMHRFRGAEAAGSGTFRALIVDADDAQATELAVRINAAHGIPLTADDRAAHAVLLIAGGATQARAGEACGLSQRQVSEAVALDKARKVAAKVGCGDTFAGLKATAQRHCARAAERTPVFAAAVELAAMKGVSVRSLNNAVDRALSFGSDREALAELGDTMDHLEAAASRPASQAAGRRQYQTLTSVLCDLMDLDPAAIAEGAVPSGADRMSERLVDAARHLMAIDKALQSKYGPRRRVA